MSTSSTTSPVLIIGAGPAGLTAAYELQRSSTIAPPLILEQDGVVGGLSRTVEHNGNLFDIGGHRFFSKISLIERIWKEILGEDLLVRTRRSRIYYRGTFFEYPLEPLNALAGLGVLETTRCVASFIYSRLSPERPETDFESWVSNRFGRRLFSIFFKSYTEKVWGIPCRQIQADWAVERIRNLSLASAIGDAFSRRARNGEIKTLVREFFYPRRGPGMMWSTMADRLEENGTLLRLNTPAERIVHSGDRVVAVESGEHVYRASHFISSMPIRELIARLHPNAPVRVRHAADNLQYRDFLTVALIVRGQNYFPDNWIYVHDPDVQVGRIQNFTNWSPDMAAQPGVTCLGLEYFCQQHDGLWAKSDAELIDQARRELAQLRLVPSDEIIDAAVVRMPKAYPVYDASYRENLAVIREYVAGFENLQLIGRNGMHRYNNQDHSMLTGILAARNILGANYNLWDLSLDGGYQEEGQPLTDEDIAALSSSQPATPSVMTRA